MTGEFKNKIFKILFDEDTEDNQDVSNQEIHEEVPVLSVETKETSSSSIKAQDIMYRKSKNNPFIDLNDVSNVRSNSQSSENEPYEFNANISPMFGLIRDDQSTEEQKLDKDIEVKQTSKPIDAHLEIVPSPIYGYGNKEDFLSNTQDLKNIDELRKLFGIEEEKNNQNNDEISLFDNYKDE